MKKIICLFLIWIAIFAFITAFNIKGYPYLFVDEADWCIYMGYPIWYYPTGFQPYPGLIEGITNAKFAEAFYVRCFLSAIAVAWAPIALFLGGWVLFKEKFKINKILHIQTIIAMILVIGCLSLLNWLGDPEKVSPGRRSECWGWPLCQPPEPDVIIPNIAVAVTILFFVAFFSEMFLRWWKQARKKGFGIV